MNQTAFRQGKSARQRSLNAMKISPASCVHAAGHGEDHRFSAALEIERSQRGLKKNRNRTGSALTPQTTRPDDLALGRFPKGY